MPKGFSVRAYSESFVSTDPPMVICLMMSYAADLGPGIDRTRLDGLISAIEFLRGTPAKRLDMAKV